MNCARKKLRISVKKTRESFCQNTYMFFQKVVRVLDETRTCFPRIFRLRTKAHIEIDKKPSSLVYPLFFT